VDIFNAIEKAGGSLPDTKDNAALTKYFQKVYPEMDFEKVYTSDMKKMVKWYEQLKKHNIEIKLTELPEEADEEVLETVPEEKEKPKKTAKKKETTSEKTEKEEKEKPKKAVKKK
jgi:alpha-mannosidase